MLSYNNLKVDKNTLETLANGMDSEAKSDIEAILNHNTTKPMTNSEIESLKNEVQAMYHRDFDVKNEADNKKIDTLKESQEQSEAQIEVIEQKADELATRVENLLVNNRGTVTHEDIVRVIRDNAPAILEEISPILNTILTPIFEEEKNKRQKEQEELITTFSLLLDNSNNSVSDVDKQMVIKEIISEAIAEAKPEFETMMQELSIIKSSIDDKVVEAYDISNKIDNNMATSNNILNGYQNSIKNSENSIRNAFSNQQLEVNKVIDNNKKLENKLEEYHTKEKNDKQEIERQNGLTISQAKENGERIENAIKALEEAVKDREVSEAKRDDLAFMFQIIVSCFGVIIFILSFILNAHWIFKAIVMTLGLGIVVGPWVSISTGGKKC